MFSYYGCKSRLSAYYPKPLEDTIIEPFAGSARYSLLYFWKNIILYDIDKKVIGLWEYLKSVSERDILSFTKPNIGTDLRLYSKELSEPELFLLRTICQRGAGNGYVVSKWGHDDFDNSIKRLSKNLHKIRHWNILNGSYEQVPNQKATWFIDPPYMNGGKRYKHHQIDYNHLSEWCKDRRGQTIVCENGQAEWLPFSPIKKMVTIKNTIRVESVWTNISIDKNGQYGLHFL